MSRSKHKRLILKNLNLREIILICLLGGVKISASLVLDLADIFKKRSVFEAAFGPNENYTLESIQVIISQLKKKEFIKADKDAARTTKKGLNYLAFNIPIYSKKDKWDGVWRMVVFDIPEKHRKARDTLRRKLYQTEYKLIQKSVFITPRDTLKQIKNICQWVGIKKYVRFIEIKNIDNEQEMARQIFNLNDLEEKYRRFINFYQNEIKKSKIDKKFLQLYYCKILKNDPQLPVKLLPKNWVGRKAKRLFNKLTSDRNKKN